MDAKPPSSRAFITPLPGSDLLDAGRVFPREELVARVLSTFWRHCCGAPGFGRAPAPVVELSTASDGQGAAPIRTRAWWLLYDGIIEDREGPHAERLSLFFGSDGQSGQLWPRYEFEIEEKPFAVKLKFHQHPEVHWSMRVILERLANGSVHVVGRGALTGP
jgi:hypothetical protein